MHTTKYYQNQTLSVAIVSVLATPGVRRGGASVGVGVGVVGGDTVGYGGIRWDTVGWDTVALAGGGWEYGGVGHVTLSAAPPLSAQE